MHLLIKQIVPFFIIIGILLKCVLPIKIGYYSQKESLGISNMTNIKAMACIMVMVSHICGQLKGEGILALPANMGFLAVGIFFFCSGYGLMYSYINKKNYVNNFLRRRMIPVLLPFWITTLVILIIENRINSCLDIINYLFGFKLACGHFWYIKSIIILYVVFWICALIVKNKKIMITTIIILSILYDIIWQFNNGTIGQIIPFTIGIYIASLDNGTIRSIDSLSGRKYNLFVIVLGIIFAITFLFWSVIRWHVCIGEIYVYTIGIICQNIFIIFLICMLKKISIKSRTGKFIGKISYEVFLIHQIVIDMCVYALGKNNIVAILVGGISISIVIGWLFNQFMNCIICKIKR